MTKSKTETSSVGLTVSGSASLPCYSREEMLHRACSQVNIADAYILAKPKVLAYSSSLARDVASRLRKILQ